MSTWKCVNCGTEVETSFACCWNCGTSRDGVANPDFVREVDAATLPSDWVPRIECESCGYLGKVLIGRHGYQWWMLPLSIVLSCTLVGLVPWLILFVILGNLTYRACPACDAREGLSDVDGDVEPSPEAEKIWRDKHEAEQQAFRTNKNSLLAMALLIFAAVLAAALIAGL